jgi:hypothetical protein
MTIVQPTLYKLYYISICLLTFAFAAQTIFVGSQHVGNGRVASQLERERTALVEQRQQLERSLASSQSLAEANALAERQGYQFSSRVVRLNDTAAVALR